MSQTPKLPENTHVNEHWMLNIAIRETEPVRGQMIYKTRIAYDSTHKLAFADPWMELEFYELSSAKQMYDWLNTHIKELFAILEFAFVFYRKSLEYELMLNSIADIKAAADKPRQQS